MIFEITLPILKKMAINKQFKIPNLGYFFTIFIMLFLTLGAIGSSGYSLTKSSFVTQILDVNNTLINDVTINNDLHVSQNMTCKTNLNTKSSFQTTSLLTTNATLSNSIVVGDEILTSLDVSLFNNMIQSVEISQSTPISFLIGPNNSALFIHVPMDQFTDFKINSGVTSFYEFQKNTTDHTSTLVTLPNSMYAISFRGIFTLSSELNQPVSLQSYIVAYDKQLLQSTSLEISSQITPLINLSGAFEVSQTITVPVIEFNLFGIELVLNYNAINQIDSSILTFQTYVLNVYRII